MQSLISDAQDIVARLQTQRRSPDKLTTAIPEFALSDVIRLIATHTKESIRQVFPVFQENFDPTSYELQIWRRLAQRKLNVATIYVVPHAGFAKSAIEAAISIDDEAGVSSCSLTLSAISQDRPIASISPLVFCDDQLVLRSERGHGPNPRSSDGSWILSARSYEVEQAQEAWSSLYDFAQNDATQEHTIDLEEPLVLSADLLSGVANVLCSGDHVDRTNCSWYHGNWQYLRLLDLVSTPTWHDQFYRTSFDEILSNQSDARVLVSGTADYSLLAYILAAARRLSAAPDITVLDQCATPLFACRWLAKETGANINTIQADIFDAQSVLQGKFHCITSDAFLTRFSPEQANDVVKVWSKLLIPTYGRIVTTVRMHDQAVTIRNEEEAVADFLSRARARLPRWQPFIKTPTGTVLEAFDTYARKMISNKIGNSDDIRNLMIENGLQIVGSEFGDVPGELYPTVYLRLVACTDS